MRKLLSIVLLLVVVFLALGNLSVQAGGITNTRQPITAEGRVLQEFSLLIGETVTVKDVQKLTVTAKTFRSTALDCVKSSVGGYAQVLTPGYIVTFKYQGVTFDYRTDVRLTNVLLCRIKVK